LCFLISCKKDEENKPVSCYTEHTLMDTAVLLVMGQSNAANNGKIPYTATCSQAASFYAGNFYPLADPLQGATGGGGSVWSRLGDLLVQNGFAHTVIIAPAAVGGTTIQQWKPGGELNHLITETVASLQAKGLTITHVLWHQGESNNTAVNTSIPDTTNARQYRDAFLEIVAQLRSMGVTAPVFPAIATRCGSVAPDTALENVQRNLANDSLGIFNGPNTDLLGLEYRYDGCHFSEQGLKVHALLWADILLAH
jgi:hypothetical protein